MTPRLSILVPVYNAESLLKLKLENLLQVTKRIEGIEVVISINKSLDNTEKIARSMLARLPENFQVFFQPTFLEGVPQFKWLFDNSKGDWVFYSAVDDLLGMDSLSSVGKTLNLIENEVCLIGSWRFNPPVHGDRLFTLELSGEKKDRLKELFSKIKTANGLFYSIQRREIWLEYWETFGDLGLLDWIMDTLLTLRGQFVQLEHMHTTFGAASPARAPGNIQKSARNFREKILPYWPMVIALTRLAKKEGTKSARQELYQFAISIVFANLHRYFVFQFKKVHDKFTGSLKYLKKKFLM